MSSSSLGRLQLSVKREDEGQSEAMVLSPKRLDCPLWVQEEWLPQVQVFLGLHHERVGSHVICSEIEHSASLNFCFVLGSHRCLNPKKQTENEKHRQCHHKWTFGLNSCRTQTRVNSSFYVVESPNAPEQVDGSLDVVQLFIHSQLIDLLRSLTGNNKP